MNSILQNSKILVTGGAGFIGSNLIESFLKAENYVTCLDNFSTGKRENIKEFTSRSDFQLIEGDIRDMEVCIQATRNVDFVFHQAALGSVPRSIADPVTTTDVNIGGFVKMLYASKLAGVKRFVYAASSSTYGDLVGLPKVEDKIGNPLSPYAVTKFADELFASNFASVYRMEIVGLRYFNVFGRRQDPEGPYAAVIPKFILMMKNHLAPVINGDGTNSRDFTYIDNVIQANHLAALATDKQAINQIYNIAHGERTSLNELFSMLKKFSAEYDSSVESIEPLYGPEREGDVLHSQASIEKAKRLLRYSPVQNVETGLKEAVGWFWNNL
jgi:UDP-N-acetylglucosamine/UDP-N-acetylgalactosamine 4-epimerase